MTMGVQDRPALREEPPEPVQPDDTQRPRALRRQLSIVLVTIALALWLVGLRPVDPDTLDGYGLLRALSFWTLAAYPIVIAAGVAELLLERPRRAALVLISAALLLMIYGLQPIVLETARLPTAWLHAGFAEHILHTGEVIPQFDARFSWAGFFATVAFWASAAGQADVLAMLKWAPVVNTGLAALAIHAIARSVFGDGSVRAERRVWMATWLFLCGNFVEQDYFSPQAMALVLLYAALALTVRFLVSPGILEGGRILPWRNYQDLQPDRRRVPAELGVAAIAIVLAPTHQLTPYVLAIALGVLLVWGRLRSPWLPVIVAVPALAWFALGAKEFWLGNLVQIVSSVGDLGASVSQGVGDRLVGDVGHQVVVAVRIALTAFIGLLALIGWFRHRRATGATTWTLPALAAGAFALAALQPYGGEIFLRCFLYALPWLCIGGALALDLGATSRSGGVKRARARMMAVVAYLVLAALCLSTTFARGGNDAYSDFKQSDQVAMSWIYAHAEKGDLVVAPLWFAPLRISQVADVGQLSTLELGEPCTVRAEMPRCLDEAGADFILLTPQEKSAGEILYGYPSDWMDEFRQTMIADYGYTVGFVVDGRWVLIR